MGTNFKKNPMGYNYKDVEEQFTNEKNRFKKDYSKYESELGSLVNKNQKLKKEIDSIEVQMADYKKIRKDIESKLYSAHIDACKKVYNTGKKFDDMVEYKAKIIEKQQNKNSQIKASINKLIEKIQSIIKE